MRVGVPQRHPNRPIVACWRRAEKASAPPLSIDFHKLRSSSFCHSAERSNKEPGEAVAHSLSRHRSAARHKQQRRPTLASVRVWPSCPESHQLKRLLDLLETFDLPAAPIEIGDGLRAPLQMVVRNTSPAVRRPPRPTRPPAQPDG